MENNFNPTSIKIPGKVFLLGEYIVLAGAPALLVATPQEDEFEKSEHSQIEFHPDSPAGKISSKILGYKKTQNLLGLGSSTADFIFAYRMAEKPMNLPAIYAEYKKVANGSGADLLTQFLGGWVSVQEGVARSLNPPQFSRQILLFSAAHQESRKVKTHEHLGTLNRGQLEGLRERLEPVVFRGIESLRLSDARILGELFNEFASVLAEHGLEHPETRVDRTEIQKIAGVYGVKGCGAMMADSLIVSIEKREQTRTELLSFARERNLNFLGSLDHVSSGTRETL